MSSAPSHQCQSARSGRVTFSGGAEQCIAYRAECSCDAVWHVAEVPREGETNFTRLSERIVSRATGTEVAQHG